MCLILFAVNPNAENCLTVAANRDEFHARPTNAAALWDNNDNILGGLDLEAGGTWLGVTKTGRFAAVTNFAEPTPKPMPKLSRGALTSEFLQSDLSNAAYLETIQHKANEYRGFNLLLADGDSVAYYSNRGNEIQYLTSGYYGLSNQLLNCDWPKVNTGKAALQASSVSKFEVESLFDLLGYRGDNADHSARFIIGENYGTSVCTVVKIKPSSLYFEERRFDVHGDQNSKCAFDFKLS